MHIFCDESGSARDGVFVAAAVLCDHAAAGQALRRIRKALHLKDELHATHLDAGRRAKALRILGEAPLPGCAVFCLRTDVHGGWALTLPEDVLWAHMMCEAAIGVLRPGTTCRGLTADARFKKSVAERQLRAIAAALEAECGAPVPARCQGSHSVPGLQLADLIANATFRVWADRASPEEHAACEALQQSGLLTVAKARLPALTPSWLAQPEKTEAASEEAAS